MRRRTGSTGSITPLLGTSSAAILIEASARPRPGVGARLLKGEAAAEAVDAIAAHWGEADGDDAVRADPVRADPVYERVVAWLAGTKPPSLTAARRDRRRPINPGGVIAWVGRHGLPLTKASGTLPPRSAYINASQFPLWVASSFEWLERRRDISALFFIHDLLPVLMPEYFRKAEFERHQKRLSNFARFGSAAIVTTKTVAADLTAHMAALGRHDLPIFQAPTPIAATFTAPAQCRSAAWRHPVLLVLLDD